MPARTLRRSHRLLGLLLALAAWAALPAPSCRAFDFEWLVERARGLSGEGFYDGGSSVPDWLTKITYDQWRDIRYRNDHALWKDDGLPFQLQFFHPGLFYNRPVAINLVEGSVTRPVAFLPSQFDYGRNDFASRVPQELGYAGFRLHAAIKSAEYLDEVIVFLGASYFRGVGRDQVFGLSARGLAIDTAEPWGEEFPVFREFWIEKPEPGAGAITLYALLDSPGIVGAYGFVVRPGAQTVTEVHVRLFPRRDVKKLGVAPLTSMFFHGENTERRFDDFRPEAHDSDGLLVRFDSGDWLWRPLDNPEALSVSRIAVDGLRGFGLVQRDRSFSSYQDLETRAELRPSAWVEPIGEWGEGRIELVEIPTKDDTNDNVVAYWVPERAVKAKQRLEFTYRLYWYGDDLERPPLARAIATWRDSGGDEESERFVVDFAGPALEEIPADEVLHGSLGIRPEDGAELVGQHVVKNPFTGGWRFTFHVRRRGNEPVELRARLDRGGEPLTEIWATTLP